MVGTPAFVYDLKSLKKAASEVLAFPNAFGITVRFAMKASPNAAILKILETEVLFFLNLNLFHFYSNCIMMTLYIFHFFKGTTF